MHTLIMQSVCCIFDIITTRPILLFDYWTINNYRMIHFCVMRIRQDYPNELLVNPNWVNFTLFVCILDGTHSRFSPFNCFLKGLFMMIRFILPWLIAFFECYFHADWLLFDFFSILCFESLYFRIETTRHSQFFICIRGFRVYWVITASPSICGSNVELSLFKWWTIKWRWMLVEITVRFVILSRSWNNFPTLKNTLLLSFTKNECHQFTSL